MEVSLDKIAQDFIDFIGEDGILVAHNASFDVNFVNYQLEELGFETYSFDRVIDTLEIAKSKFPGQRNSLDVLCKRFGVDNSKRTFHGALLDAELLADVYLELLGGAEPTMDLATNIDNKKSSNSGEIKRKREYREPRKFVISEEEFNNHRSFLEKNIKNPIWLADEVVKEEGN